MWFMHDSILQLMWQLHYKAWLHMSKPYHFYYSFGLIAFIFTEKYVIQSTSIQFILPIYEPDFISL
jgi:hypothetical protein